MILSNAAPASLSLPGPRGLPVLGSAVPYFRDPLGFLLRLRRDYGDFVRLRIGGIPIYLVSRPELVEAVLVTDNRSYIKDPYLLWLSEVLGQGLLTSEGEFWRRQRRLAQPAFHKERISAYGAMMVQAAERMLAGYAPGQERDLHADLMGLTLDIVTRTLLGAEVGEVTADVGRALEVLTRRYANMLLAAMPALRTLPLPGNRRFLVARRCLDEIIYGFIRQRRARPEPGEPADLLSMLLQARDEAGAPMTDRQIRDEAITIFLAGHETTALALSYALRLLAAHPEAERRLIKELRPLSARPVGVADLPSLRYTEAVVLESMRLYPPAWVLGREVARETELGGQRLRRGEQVWISQFVMHRDPAWFPEPEAFRPERWLDGLQRRLPRFAYFPFGGGPRQCIGNAFAHMEAVLLLCTIAGRFRFTVLPEPPLALLPSVTLRPRHGIRVRVEAR